MGQFKLSWNSHGVRTERGKTPNQLFTEGALRLHNSGQTAVDFFDSASEIYGVDFEDDSISPDDDPEDAGVMIPTIQVDISDEQIEELKATIDPLSDSDDYGLDIYQRTLDFLNGLNSDQHNNVMQYILCLINFNVIQVTNLITKMKPTDFDNIKM